MPHVTLEYTANVSPKDVKGLTAQIHALLVEKLSTSLDNCRTRIVAHKYYWVGDGRPQNAFVHLKIEILKGRSDALRAAVGQELLELLKNHFPQVAASVVILEMPDHYYRA